MSRNVVAAESNEKGVGKLVPRLRFPEFRLHGAWEPTALGSVSSILKGKGISKADLDSGGSQPCIRYGELYTRYGETIRTVVSRTRVHSSELFLSKTNDVVIPSSGESKIDIAKASCVLVDGVALGGDLNVIRSKLDGTFLSYSLNGPVRLAIARVAQGDTVVHLYPHQLAALPIAVPIPAEQQKVAECLSSVDAVIAAQARKVDALKTHKDGLMQQLFPREGETQPRRRFPEFQDTADWLPKAGGELFTQRKEKGDGQLPIYSVTVNDGMIPRAAFDRNFYDIEDPAGNRKVYKGDLAYNMMRMWQGAQGVAPVDCLVSPAYVVLKPRSGVCSDFFAYLFKLPQMLRLLTATSRGLTKDRLRLYFEDFAKMPLRVAAEAEQHRIASCLSSLDVLITAESRKLDALKRHKRGLMQQLFPSSLGGAK
jgi:type I restriction enzyme S subunit